MFVRVWTILYFGKYLFTNYIYLEVLFIVIKNLIEYNAYIGYYIYRNITKIKSIYGY